MNLTKNFISIIFISIFILVSCTKTPTACIDMPATGAVAQVLSFSSSCSKDASTFEWDFGDGTKSTEATATHAYVSAGTYTVKLMAMSKDGKKMNETSKSLRIN